MELSVVAAAREGWRPPEEARHIALVADRLGYREVWVGEGPTWDGFALATAIGLDTSHVAITVGPVPVSVRDPAMVVRGAANVAALTGHTVGIALGSSSTRLVEGFHGRSRARAATVLAVSARAVRDLLTGEIASADTDSFRSRLPLPDGQLTVAAFGERAIAAAAEHADRMALDLVSPQQVTELHAKLVAAAARVDRPPPKLAAWLPTAVDADEESYRQIMQSIAGYLTVRGYAELFTGAGFGEAVEKARAGAALPEVIRALPPEATGVVGLVSDLEQVRARIDAYAAAGLDEVAIVPATAGDPAGEHTLTALARIT